MVDSVEAPDPTTVVFRLKFATNTFLPSLADPFAFIYSKAILDKDVHWYEKHVMGSGPFKFVSHDIGQSIKGERNPDYYHKGMPYLDGFIGIFADKQVVRVEAIRSGRAAMEFRGLPPSAINDLQRELGDKVTVQTQRLELRQRDHAQPASASRSTTCGCAGRCCWPSISGTARRRCRRSPTCTPWAASCSPARRWRRPRRNCRSWPASGPTSRSRAPRPGAC